MQPSLNPQKNRKKYCLVPRLVRNEKLDSFFMGFCLYQMNAQTYKSNLIQMFRVQNSYTSHFIVTNNVTKTFQNIIFVYHIKRQT